MATSRQNIMEWLEWAKDKKATYMVVVCDTFSYDDYPVFVTHDMDVREVVKTHHGPNMQKVMEVYDLSKPLEPQLNAVRTGQEYL